MKKINFNSGPSVLPPEVLQQSAAGIIELNAEGISIAEISHRSKMFQDILAELIALIRELLSLNDDYEVLVVQGGGRLQFAQIPMNFLNTHETAAFIDTGYWAHKAMEYTSAFGNTEIICTGAQNHYHQLPEFAIDKSLTDFAYLQMTSNNTIYGTQYISLPQVDTPLIVDMSSDILSIERDFNHIDLAFACAQKNIGPAGISIVIIKKSFLEKCKPETVPVLNYKNIAEHNSNYATLPVVNVYISLLNLRWLKRKGGVAQIQKHNEEKANLLYSEIDRNTLFECKIMEQHRSMMNVCFFAIHKDIERRFTEFYKQKNIVGLSGHQEAGGFRASLYNAQPMESVQYLVEVMREFEKGFSL